MNKHHDVDQGTRKRIPPERTSSALWLPHAHGLSSATGHALVSEATTRRRRPGSEWSAEKDGGACAKVAGRPPA
eukprot:12407392-Alexandrium_andersonii.AAC.1